MSKNGDTYYFNLCAQTMASCKPTENEIFAYKKNDATNTCEELTDLSLKQKPAVLQSNGKNYVQMQFGSPKNKCTDPAKTEP